MICTTHDFVLILSYTIFQLLRLLWFAHFTRPYCDVDAISIAHAAPVFQIGRLPSPMWLDIAFNIKWFWIIAIVLPAESIGNYSKSCLWFSTFTLIVINMQSTRTLKAKTIKWILFLFNVLPCSFPPHLESTSAIMQYGYTNYLFFFLYGFLLEPLTITQPFFDQV